MVILFHSAVNRSIRIYWEVLSTIEQSICLHYLSTKSHLIALLFEELRFEGYEIV